MALPSLGTIVQYVVVLGISYILFGSALIREYLGTGDEQANDEEMTKRLLAQIPGGKLDNLVVPDADLVCANHTYSVRIFSHEPLVVYIDGFLSQDEVTHLMTISWMTGTDYGMGQCCPGLSEPLYTPSTVWSSGREHLDSNVRLSEKAMIPRDKTVQCIEQRALAFQGHPPYTFIERLWTQRYKTGGHYALHYDWGMASKYFGRVSSFMVYLGDECIGGGTHFPRLRRPTDKSWCEVIECGEEGADDGDDEKRKGKAKGEGESKGEVKNAENQEGVTWKAKSGNAVFWINLREDGSGFEEAWHAGMPVRSGIKVGLNIWSWHQEGYRPGSSIAQSAEAMQ